MDSGIFLIEGMVVVVRRVEVERRVEGTELYLIGVAVGDYTDSSCIFT